MEVSVIGTSQAQIGRSESAIRDLALFNPKLDAFTAKNRVGFVRNWRFGSRRLRFSLKAVDMKSQVVESDQVSAAGCSARFSRAKDGVKMFVGLPLDVVSNSQAVNHSRAVAAGLKALKLLGIEGVELPVWWGVAENETMGKYEWSGYLTVAEMVKKAGLKLHVSLCFHGSNEAKIGLPKWVSEIGEKQPDVYFMDKSGECYRECLSIAADDVPVLQGKTALEVYKEFCDSFKASFTPYLGSTITGITMGLGPDGELRYPSDHYRNLNCSVQGVGEFQCYDKNMLSNLKNYAEASGNPLWGLGGPHDVPSYNQSPDASQFFKDNGGSWESPYGSFFLTWYSNQLVSHGDALLSMASSTFRDNNVSVSGVVPLMYLWNGMRSHPAELTAGFYNTETRDGYVAVTEMFARNSSKMIVRGMESSLLDSSPESSLLEQIMSCCVKHEVRVSGKNSRICQGTEGFSGLKRKLMDENGMMDSFTYQRMGAVFFSPEHFHSFTELVRSINGCSLGSADLPDEKIETVESNRVINEAKQNLQMQTA